MVKQVTERNSIRDLTSPTRRASISFFAIYSQVEIKKRDGRHTEETASITITLEGMLLKKKKMQECARTVGSAPRNNNHSYSGIHKILTRGYRGLWKEHNSRQLREGRSSPGSCLEHLELCNNLGGGSLETCKNAEALHLAGIQHMCKGFVV